jgi:putative phosphoribosyl transferase
VGAAHAISQRRREDPAMEPEQTIGTAADLDRPEGPFAREVAIEAAPGVLLWGDLLLPRGRSSRGIIVLPDGLGSSWMSPGSGRAARVFNEAGIATLRLGLLTSVEEEYLANMFDVELLARRLLAATDWLGRQAETAMLARGYFGAAGGAAAVALRAAAKSGARVCAVLSRGARVAQAAERSGDGRRSVLLIPARADADVTKLAADWFLEHLGDGATPRRRRTRLLADLRSVASSQARALTPR